MTPVRVAFVGGPQRLEQELARAAEELGVEVECHDGHMTPRSRAHLDALIGRADAAIVFIGVNSHGAVGLTKKLAARHGKPLTLVRSAGTTVARRMLLELASGVARGARETRWRACAVEPQHPPAAGTSGRLRATRVQPCWLTLCNAPCPSPTEGATAAGRCLCSW